MNFMDTSACDAMLSAIKRLQAQGITFAFARVRGEVREQMRLGGVEAAVGLTSFYERLTDGVRLAAADGPRPCVRRDRLMKAGPEFGR